MSIEDIELPEPRCKTCDNLRKSGLRCPFCGMLYEALPVPKTKPVETIVQDWNDELMWKELREAALKGK